MYRPVQQQPQGSVRAALFSQRNTEMLENKLVQDFQQRAGAGLTAQQRERLGRTLDHYMEEVYEVQGEKPLAALNQEILRATATDFSKYNQRKEAVRTAPEAPVKMVMNEQLFQETGKRFELLQQERQEVKALPPAMPDFRISLDDDGPSAAEMFERAKKAREAEASRMAASGRDAMERIDPNVNRMVEAADTFRAGQLASNKATDLALVERRTQLRPAETALIVPPDRRELMLPANAIVGGSTIPTLEAGPSLRDLGIANGNSTITMPPLTSAQKVNLPQDVLIRQDPIVTYREIENNLILYSADRDWLKNTRENRYSFTVNFDPANNRQGFAPSPATQQRFKNITRIELVKAIMPAEGIDVLITQFDGAPVTTYQNSILSFPFLTVNVQELDGNNYGTDNFLDRSFGVLQYDANWYSDPASQADPQDSRGYLAMIPKFMKCQRVYHPTPLSTLQKLSISMLRPDGTLVSTVPDTLDIYNIFASNTAGAFVPSAYDVTVGGQPAYFFINTAAFFSRFQVSVGDRIQIGGFNYDDATLAANPGLVDFVQWINRAEGHLVAAIGYTNTSGTYIADGANGAGYANYIIIQARYADPTTGQVALQPFTNITAALAGNMGGLLLPRRLLNLNRQIQLVFRVITREMDGVGQLRPDNM